MSLPLPDSLPVWFVQLGGIDPAPFFVLSLLPYLAFLRWAGQVRGFPPLARRGFQLTLLFVAVTIAAALLAERTQGRQLADVDPLHGGAEAFLTLSNLLVLLGFAPGRQLTTTPATGSGVGAEALGAALPANPAAPEGQTAPQGEQVLSGRPVPVPDPEDGASASAS